jgi:hypothetical protein
MTDELTPQPKPFVTTPELQAAIDAALAAVLTRTYAGRNPQLGKMINCQVCRSRHRKNVVQCEQVFTHRMKGDDGKTYMLLKDDESGEPVPDYRTCTKEGERPTMKQLMGAAAFKKKRFHPHPSKIKLLLINYTREAFETLGFSLKRNDKDSTAPEEVLFQKNLQRARVVAARRIRKERRLRTRATNRQADKSHRINKGLL